MKRLLASSFLILFVAGCGQAQPSPDVFIGDANHFYLNWVTLDAWFSKQNADQVADMTVGMENTLPLLERDYHEYSSGPSPNISIESDMQESVNDAQSAFVLISEMNHEAQLNQFVNYDFNSPEFKIGAIMSKWEQDMLAMQEAMGSNGRA